jgi:hypothetical protein
MKISAREKFRLLEVFKANAMGCAYYAETLTDFDYLRGNGLVRNGMGNAYGHITLTEAGTRHIQKLAEQIRMTIL